MCLLLVLYNLHILVVPEPVQSVESNAATCGMVELQCGISKSYLVIMLQLCPSAEKYSACQYFLLLAPK